MEKTPLHLLPYFMQKSIDELQSIASRIGLYGLQNSKQRLVSGIAQKIVQRTTLERLLADLEEEACELLQFFVVRSEVAIVSQDLQNPAWRAAGSDRGFILSELMQCGLVGIGTDENRMYHSYALFEEVKGPLRALMLPNLPDPLAEQPAPKNFSAGTNTWLEDTITLLGYLHRDRIPLMKNGELSQREIRKILPLLRGTRTEELAQEPVSGGSSWFARLFRLAHGAGLLCEQEGSLVPGKKAFQATINLFGSPKKALDRILSMEGSYPGFETDLKCILNLHRKCCRKGSAWLSVESLQNHMYPPLPGGQPAQNQQRISAILYGFFSLGLCDLGHNGEDLLWRPHPELEMIPEDSFGFIHLQPNFEIVAPANLAWESRVVLEQIAELISIDTLLNYRITRDSVYRGFCSGWSADEQIRWYTRQLGDKRTIPQNVHHSIESWGIGYGRIGLETPLLLVCETPMLADDIYHSKEISQHCLGYLAPHILILKAGSEKAAIDSLQRMGHLPHPDVGDGTRWIHSGDRGADPVD